VLENGNGRFLQLFYCQYEESMGLSKWHASAHV
jgi:hypothetical protein